MIRPGITTRPPCVPKCVHICVTIVAMKTVLSVRELRIRLRDVIDQAKIDRPSWVGAHRVPEVVVMGVRQLEREVPPPAVLETMLVDVAVATAHDDLCSPYSTMKRGDVWHPGDPFGKVLAWLWTTGQEDHAASLVADLLAQARYHNPHGVEPRLAFADLLDGIPMSLPNGTSQESADALVEHLREAVPKYFGDDDLDAPVTPSRPAPPRSGRTQHGRS